jgi:hypothetical protein
MKRGKKYTSQWPKAHQVDPDDDPRKEEEGDDAVQGVVDADALLHNNNTRLRLRLHHGRCGRLRERERKKK